MMCADWVVTGFLKSVLGGASLGRALLEAKQDFVNWIQKQGRSPDLAEEKTLLQFVLLGDPSIHPVAPSLAGAGPATAASGPAPAGMALSTSLAGQGATAERSARRAYRLDLGETLRGALPERRRVAAPVGQRAEAPAAVARLTAKRIAGATARKVALAGSPEVGGGKALAEKPEESELRFDFSKPLVQRVTANPREVETARRRGRASAATATLAAPAPQPREVLEYYWSARHRVGKVTEVRMIQVVADKEGNVLRSRMVVSS
jgi:hypothetical protein